MKIYISHARKDSNLARQLAKELESRDLHVFLPETLVGPGDNWAEKIGEALDRSDFMVFLLTPGALEADWQRKDVEYALGAKKYEGHVFSVLVGLPLKAGKDVPWILLKQPHRRVESARKFGEVAEEIEEQCSSFAKDSAHA
jgi:TIR domain